MSFYWAKFEWFSDDLFRFDTRIYLQPKEKADDSDTCIGAVVGKNPGSARPSLATEKLQPLSLDGDKLLPTVRNIVRKAYLQANKPLPKSSYIQVYNLFYLCEPKLNTAIRAWSNSCGPDYCESESKYIPWTWYVWGGEHAKLNGLKTRFLSLKTDNPFFYNNKKKEVELTTPGVSDFARHTQGLKHEDIVQYLSKVISADIN